MIKFTAPKLLAYYESNLPFYSRGIALVDAAYQLELEGGNQWNKWDHSIFYDVGWEHNASGRNANSHGRCSGGKANCHHCQN